jgi:hypothetical protein
MGLAVLMAEQHASPPSRHPSRAPFPPTGLNASRDFPGQYLDPHSLKQRLLLKVYSIRAPSDLRKSVGISPDVSLEGLLRSSGLGFQADSKFAAMGATLLD